MKIPVCRLLPIGSNVLAFVTDLKVRKPSPGKRPMHDAKGRGEIHPASPRMNCARARLHRLISTVEPLPDSVTPALPENASDRDDPGGIHRMEAELPCAPNVGDRSGARIAHKDIKQPSGTCRSGGHSYVVLLCEGSSQIVSSRFLERFRGCETGDFTRLALFCGLFPLGKVI